MCTICIFSYKKNVNVILRSDRRHCCGVDCESDPSQWMHETNLSVCSVSDVIMTCDVVWWLTWVPSPLSNPFAFARLYAVQLVRMAPPPDIASKARTRTHTRTHQTRFVCVIFSLLFRKRKSEIISWVSSAKPRADKIHVRAFVWITFPLYRNQNQNGSVYVANAHHHQLRCGSAKVNYSLETFQSLCNVFVSTRTMANTKRRRGIEKKKFSN